MIFAYSGPGPDSHYLFPAITGAAPQGPFEFLGHRGGQGWGMLIAPAGQPPTLHRALSPLSDAADQVLSSCAGIDGVVLGHSQVIVEPSGVLTRAHMPQLQPVLTANLPTDAALVYDGSLANPDDFWPAAPTAAQALARAYAVRRANNIPAGQAFEQMMEAAQHRTGVLAAVDGGRLYAYRHQLPLYVVEHPTGVYLSSSGFASAAHLLPEDQLHVW